MLYILQKTFPILFLGSAFLNSGCKAGTENSAVTQPGIVQNYTAVVEYNSGNNAELVDAVRVNTQHNWDMGAVVYSIQLSDAKEGDLLEYQVDMEVTNDLLPDQTVAITTAIILADSPLKRPGDPGVFPVGSNIAYYVTPDMHHGHITLSGRKECPSAFNTNIYANFCLSAQSSQAGVSDSLTVNQDYGRLSIVVFKSNE